MRVTIKQINNRIKQYGYEIVAANDYFYFAPLDPKQKMLDNSSVAVFRLHHLTLDQWERELIEKLEAEPEATDEPSLIGSRFILTP